MQPIVSSTSKEHLVRLLIFFVAGLGAGGYFLYDGLVGYEKDNVAKLTKPLRPPLTDADRQSLQSALRKDIKKDSEKTVSTGDSLDEVKKKLGEPAHIDDDEQGSYHYLGRAGRLTIRHDGRAVKSVLWTPGPHSETDIFLQFVYAGICGAVALFAGAVILRAISRRTALDDEGLKVAGHDKIPWDAMQALDARDYQKKGWMDLQYSKDGATKTARLDSYKIAKFREIVAALCERKGFENPLTPASANAPSE